MIDTGYVRTMARYNAWQNNQLSAALDAMDEDDLGADRGAFFGSILQTLSHLLWGDLMWMSRFYDAVDTPDVSLQNSAHYVESLEQWTAARCPLDEQITAWANATTSEDLSGVLTWYSGATDKQMAMLKALCITHFFNHQTHHRGQVHAMMTAAGGKAPVTDLPFMPEG